MINTLFFIHHSHMDIGYTDLASDVREMHLRYIDFALELCNRNHKRISGTEFHWTCESAWVIKDYLRLRTARQATRLLDALQSGRMELQAFFTQPLTNVAGGEEIIDELRFASELGHQHGFPVACGMLNDIGGYMGRLPSILNGWGVQYLVAGVGAYQVFMPWCDLPHLFYLQDKWDGKILVWNIGIDRRKKPQEMEFMDAVYYMGGTYLVSPLADEVQGRSMGGAEADLPRRSSRFKGVSEAWAYLEDRLKAEKYPFSEILLQYGRDNGDPDPYLVGLLEHLKGRKDFPEVRLTTPITFFKTMERKYDDRIPVLTGVIADPWVIRANPQPTPLAKHRAAQRTLRTAEIGRINAWLATGSIPPDTEPVYESMHLYTDHTCGLSEWGWHKNWKESEGCRNAVFDRCRESWRDKARYADDALVAARSHERAAREKLLGDMTGITDALVVWNDRATDASGIADLVVPTTQRAVKIRSLQDDTTGAPVQFQRLSQRHYLIAVNAVPSFGYRVLRVEWMEDRTPWPVETSSNGPVPAILQTDQLRIILDPATGAIGRLEDRESGRCWSSMDAGIGLGQFRYARVHGVPEMPVASGMGVKIEHEWVTGQLMPSWKLIDGPLVKSLQMGWKFPACDQTIRVTQEIRLHPGHKRIDFRYRVDKPETAEKEVCYVQFPFDLPDAIFRFDEAIGWVEPGKDLIAGAMQDAFFAAQWADLSNASQGITLVCPDAPLVQVGRYRTCEWEDRLPFNEGGSRLIAWPYHNLWQTDNPIWQDLLQEFNYTVFLHPERGFDAAQNDRLAESGLLPLRAQLAHVNGDRKTNLPPFQLESGSSRLNGGRVLADGQTVCLRLEERNGRTDRVQLKFFREVMSALKIKDFFLKDGVGLETDGGVAWVELKPLELATVVVRLGG